MVPLLCYNKNMKKLKIYLLPFLNLKFLLSFGIAWMITNGWAYVCLGLSIIFKIHWLQVVSSTYIAFLYLPFTAEKLITIPMAIFIQTKIFPNDIKLHRQLANMHYQAFKDSYKFLKVYWERKWFKQQHIG